MTRECPVSFLAPTALASQQRRTSVASTSQNPYEQALLGGEGAETAPVDGTKPPLADGRHMALGAVPLVRLEAVAGVLLGIGLHHMIARHLGHERRGGDGGALPVPLHDVHLPRIKMQRVAVQKNDVHRNALGLHLGDGGGKGLTQSRRHAHSVDIGRLHVLHRPRPGAPAHLLGDGLAVLRPHLLGVVEPGDGVVRVQHDAPHGQRSCQGPPSHLV